MDDRRGSANLDSDNNSGSFSYRSRDRNTSARFDDNGVMIRDQDKASSSEEYEEELQRESEAFIQENDPEL